MMAKKVLEKLIKNNKTICFAESMTGGAATFELVKNEGASQVVKGSIVCYSNEAKINLLGIELSAIETFGVVSREIAIRLANSVLATIGADIGVSITGNASPDNARRDVWIAISNKENTIAYHLIFDNEKRVEVISKTVDYIYQKLDNLLF